MLPRLDDPELSRGRLVTLQTQRFLLAFSISFTRLRMLVTRIYHENIVQSLSTQVVKHYSLHPNSSLLGRSWNKFLM